MQTQEFSRLIGKIYDAAVDPVGWSVALASIADYLDAEMMVLIQEDGVHPERSRYFLSSEDPEFATDYVSKYMLLNPLRLATAGRIATGDVVLTVDVMSHDEYRQTRYFREFLVRRQIADVAVAVLEKTATTITVLGAARSERQGIAGEEIRQKLEIVAPHVRRAASISRILEQRKLEAATLADTLDQLLAAVFLLGPDGALLHTNEAAQKLLAQGSFVSDVGGRLMLRDSEARAALAEALALAQQGDVALGSRGLSIQIATLDERAWIGTLMPLARGTRRSAGAPYKAAAALCLTEARFQTPSAVTEMTRLYGLTPREVTVVLAIVEIGGIPEVSQILGISEATVRAHVNAVFRKTGTKRQADLVKVVAGVLTPFG